MVTGIILAAAVVGILGILIGIFLGVASEKFKVEVDEREILVRNELPGNNCGGCGYAGCDALAKAIAAGQADVGACPVGGASAAEKIGAIMGVAGGAADKKVLWHLRQDQGAVQLLRRGRLPEGFRGTGSRREGLRLRMYGLRLLRKGLRL